MLYGSECSDSVEHVSNVMVCETLLSFLQENNFVDVEGVFGDIQIGL